MIQGQNVSTLIQSEMLKISYYRYKLEYFRGHVMAIYLSGVFVPVTSHL